MIGEIEVESCVEEWEKTQPMARQPRVLMVSVPQGNPRLPPKASPSPQRSKDPTPPSIRIHQKEVTQSTYEFLLSIFGVHPSHSRHCHLPTLIL